MNLGEEKREGKTNAILEYAQFITYSNLLESSGVDIRRLVSQIKPCKDYRNVRHARGLSELGWIYHKHGHTIEYLPKRNNPDISIDGVKADLKVSQPIMFAEFIPEAKISKDKVDIGYEIMREITQSLKSRFSKGAKQAEMLFFDMTGNRFFTALDLVLFDKASHFMRLALPQKYRAVFYSRRQSPPGLNLFTQGSNEKILTQFPNLFSFVGYSIDFEEFLWEAISKVQQEITL